MERHLDTFQELQRDLAEAQSDLTDAQRRVESLTPLVRAFEAFIKTAGVTVPAPAVAPQPEANRLPDTYPEAARVILKSAGGPLSVNELLERFAASGRPVNTSYPYRTIYKVLRTHEDLFENVGNGRWKVKERIDLLGI